MREHQKIKLSKLIPNDTNPRFIRDEKYRKLLKSIQESSAFMQLRPIIVDVNMMILGGNMRYKACQELKLKEVDFDIFTQEMADEMNQKAKDEGREEKTYQQYCDEFIIKDNVGFGEWNYDDLANKWDSEQLEEWGLDVVKHDWDDLEFDQEPEHPNESKPKNLITIFLSEDFMEEKDNVFEQIKSYVHENFEGCEVK